MAPGAFNWLCRFVGFVALLAAVAAPVQAQESSTGPLTKPQLEQLVAPIALHADPLLSQMLMASTYPTEVVQAARWARENSAHTGQALQDALQKQPWDPSVKALTAVPQTLEMMSAKLDWTQRLGDAFLAQQEELLAAVQRLRQRAEAAGHLRTSDQQTVSRVVTPMESGTASIITIEPASLEYMHFPVYDPRVVYGDWPYPDYEPFYWHPAGFTGRSILAFAAGVAVGSAIWGTLDWRRGRVDIDIDRYNQFNRTNVADKVWRHDPRHRGNVPYRDATVAQRFGDANRTAAREAYRGKAEAGRRDLAKAHVAKPEGATKAKPTAKTKSAANKKQPGKSPGGDAKAKSAAKTKSAAHAKHAAKGKSATRTQQTSKQAARSKQASRPKTATHRPQAKGHTASRKPHYAYRKARGGQLMEMRGGGRRGRR